MKLYNAASWLLDRNVSAGAAQRNAYRVEGRSVSYAELQREVWRVQNALALLGVRPGDRVALVLNDELAFPAWFLGAMRSGVVPVPLSTMLTAADLASIVADADAAAVVVSADYGGHLTAIRERAQTLRHALVTGGQAAAQRHAPTAGHQATAPRAAAHCWSDFTDMSEAPVATTGPESVAFWLYSSGTTGVPKGVMHRHASPQATAETYARRVLGVTSDDRFLSVAKLFFAFGLGNSLTFPLAVGGCAILNPRRPSAAQVLDLIRAEQPTLFFANPRFIAALLDADPPGDAFASIRCTVTAGEALPADLHRRYKGQVRHPVLDGIGSTEALHNFLSNTPGAERPDSSGIPVPGWDIEIVDDVGSVVIAPDTPGHLRVRGPSLAAGYWRREDASRSAFRGGWLATGDIYSRSADGYWTCLGRSSDMIKAGGIWVSPVEVEGVLLEHPDVLEAGVVGGRDENGLEITVAFVVPRAGHRIDARAIDAHCRARMAVFKRPRRIIVVDRLPMTATGKVQRYALRDRLAAAAATGAGPVRPRRCRLGRDTP